MLSHPEPPPFQLKVMSNIARSVKDWPFSIPWVSFCWPLILVTHLLLSCTLKKLIIRQHASFSHCLANKLQAAIREVCAKQCVAESCRFFKLAGWVTWISMTDSRRAAWPHHLVTLKWQQKNKSSASKWQQRLRIPQSSRLVLNVCRHCLPSHRFPSLLAMDLRSLPTKQLQVALHAVAVPHCCQLPLRCEYQGHPRTKKSPSWYKYCKWDRDVCKHSSFYLLCCVRWQVKWNQHIV